MNIVTRNIKGTTIRAIPAGQEGAGLWYVLQDVLKAIGYGEADPTVHTLEGVAPFHLDGEQVNISYETHLFPWLERLNDEAKTVAKKLRGPSVTPETLPEVSYKGVPVITTDLLAEMYSTDDSNIYTNFSRNQDRFVEGTHFFRLEGEALKQFKELNCLTDSKAPLISPFARNLTLWTERGAFYHAKILNTDPAWDVYSKLVDAYFRQKETAPAFREPKDPALAAIFRMILAVEDVKQEVAEVKTQLPLIEERIQNVEIQSQNGVPIGYLSKKQAYNLHAPFLSKDMFYKVVAALDVRSQRYRHDENGYQTQTVAYHEQDLIKAMEKFKASIRQVSPKYCASDLVPGTFRYTTGAA